MAVASPLAVGGLRWRHGDCETSARRFADDASLALHVLRAHGWDYLPRGFQASESSDAAVLPMAAWAATAVGSKPNAEKVWYSRHLLTGDAQNSSLMKA